MKSAAPIVLAAALLAGCASLQRNCARHPWMLCGDRVTVQKNFVYLDDPAFLYKNNVVAERHEAVYGFRLSFFFNPYHAQSLLLSAAVRPNRSAGRGAVPCVIANGGLSPEGIDSTVGQWDSAFAVTVSRKKDRVNLAFACRDYLPKWGREDTLALRFADRPGDSVSSMQLPFSTSFHGPLYSVVIGSVLIVGMTILGEFLANNR
jgi:hypothetical protein